MEDPSLSPHPICFCVSAGYYIRGGGGTGAQAGARDWTGSPQKKKGRGIGAKGLHGNGCLARSLGALGFALGACQVKGAVKLICHSP